MGCSAGHLRPSKESNTVQEGLNSAREKLYSTSTSETTSSFKPVSKDVVSDLDRRFPTDILNGVTFDIPEDSQPIQITDKITYRGQWANGRQHGVGETKYADGSVYLGEYKDGKPHGRGIFRTRDSSEYKGEFYEGKAQGYGVYTDKDGSIYAGPYMNDRREGVGREIQSDGLQYVGEYVKGNKHGKGELIAPNGEMYTGEFCNGEIHGFGTYTWPDGRIYVGQWDRNRQNGKAEFKWPDGRVYRGQYANGRLQGHGVLEWKDGRKYDGQWKNGLQNGIGKYWGSPHWYREAQFMDGVRVKWLGGIVYVDEGYQATPPRSNEEPTQDTSRWTPKNENTSDTKKNDSPSTGITDEELLNLKGTVAQRIAQFGQKQAITS